MKLKIIICFLFVHVLQAQTYDKDWDKINKKLESGQLPTIKETENFLSAYNKQLLNYADNTTQLYSLLGNAYSKTGEAEKAEENYLLSLQFAQKASDTSLKHIVEYSLGVLNYNQNNLLKAEQYYLACLPGMSAIYGQSSREYTQIFKEYTSLLVDLGKYKEANPYVDALLYYYKTLDGENNFTYISLLNSKGIIYQQLGDYKNAIAIFSNIADDDMLMQLGDTASGVIQISNLGDVYREAGNFELATTNLLKARNLFFKYHLKNKETLATIENNLGLCYKAMSDPQKSEAAYNNALAIYKEIGKENSEPYCTTLSNKANLYSDLGRNGEASELLWTAIEIRKKYFGEMNVNYANALANLANVYFSSGFYQQSLEKNLEANAVYKQTIGENHQDFANNLNSLSLCYLQLKDYSKAEEYKLRALRITELTVGKNHYRYADYLISTEGIYRATKQYIKAEKNLKEALLLIEHNFGRQHELYARAQFALAENYTLQQRFEEAGALYFESLDYYSARINTYFNAMSEENQAEFLQFITPLFESYNIYLVNYKLSQPDKNFSEYLERALKYRLQLKALLANRSAQVRREVANSRDENLKQLYSNWTLLKNELINNFKSAEPVTDNNALLEKSSVLETQLKTKIKSFSTQQSITFAQLRQKLSDTEAAIEIFKVNEMLNDSEELVKYGALLIRKNSAEPAFVIFKNGGLLDNKAFDDYAASIDEHKPDSLSYDLYFKPFEPYLKGIKSIYLSSDGIFNKLSFLGLYEPKNGRYLADDYEIYQTSNLGSIASAGAGSSSQALTAALFGYPDYDYDFKKNKTQASVQAEQLVAKRFGLTQLAKLPGTKKEVAEIDAALKARNWQTTVYTEQYASEENLRKVHDPKILHIATHGFYLKDIETDDKLFLGFERSAIRANPMLRSGIILAGAGPSTQDSTNLDSENDGILTAYEASLLDLNTTDLVVLSACQTGLGDEVGTEGVAGLQRSFAIAGAKNMIMSLWPVDDEATRFLMTEFYKNYSSGQRIEPAFKMAQATVRKKYPHPYYWAAFVAAENV